MRDRINKMVDDAIGSVNGGNRKDRFEKMIYESVSPMRKYLKQIDEKRDKVLTEAFEKKFGKEQCLFNHRLMTKTFNIPTENGWKEIYAVGNEVYAMCSFNEAIDITTEGINGRIDMQFDIPKEPLYIHVIDGKTTLSHQKKKLK